MGFRFGEPFQDAASTFPEVRFVVIDHVLEDPGEKANLTSVYFRVEEACFLAVVVAARLTDRGKVGEGYLLSARQVEVETGLTLSTAPFGSSSHRPTRRGESSTL